ncbi:MAG: corrinoid protein [Chloroflexota bacterium]|nr:MAG: corrinoid protein [Chloroflexota bacterium]
MSEEIDITKLETPELLELIQDDLYDGLADEVVESVNELLARGMTPYDVLNKGLVAGMDVVGVDFRDGILFVPEVLMAAKAMKAGMEILRPLLVETGAPQIGTLVIGTVKGDIHDIGKNLVAMMMEGAGFNVVNLGINTDVDAFLEAVREHNPDILGMSAMLTTTMTYMPVVIEALEEQGLRDQLLVLVGGAPLNDAFAEEIQADAYCRDAAVGVETAKKLLAIKRGQPS